MRSALLVAWCLVCVICSLAGSFLLFNWFDTLPIGMPLFIDRAIRSGFHLFLHVDMPDPDADIAPIAGLVYLVTSMVLVGTAVVILGTLVWRHVMREPKTSA